MVGNSKKLQEGCNRNTITGFEPAGGCTVRVTIISAIAVPTAKATAHQWGPNTDRQIRPTNELIKWPTITFLGWEKGTSG